MSEVSLSLGACMSQIYMYMWSFYDLLDHFFGDETWEILLADIHWTNFGPKPPS